jgi:hypothetical protein
MPAVLRITLLNHSSIPVSKSDKISDILRWTEDKVHISSALTR